MGTKNEGLGMATILLVNEERPILESCEKELADEVKGV